MLKVIKIILTVLVTSFYFFPITFTFLTIANTKNMMAALGIVFMIIELIKQRDFFIPKELLILLLISSMVSIMSLISISYNETPDSAYATYIRSAIIWLSGAFSACYVIRFVHGRIDVPLVVHYLIGVCLFQCASAILIEFIPAVRAFVDSYVMQGQTLLQDMGRLYGIGASLDVSGARMSTVLVAIAFMLVSSPQRVSIGNTILYTLSFVTITIIGCMIARTTLVGATIGLVWIVIGPYIFPKQENTKEYTGGKWIAILSTIGALVVTSVILYNSFPDVQDLFRFGFEGFFSWAETGEWQTASTNTLQNMVVWPEDFRTWIIGDGYFDNAHNDPNFMGEAAQRGFYMGTDIGYLRFIYYFGVLGLIWMIAVIAYSAFVCAKYLKAYAWIFVMALLVGLVVWAKVSTDVFLFFAIFLCVAALQGLEPTKS